MSMGDCFFQVENAAFLISRLRQLANTSASCSKQQRLDLTEDILAACAAKLSTELKHIRKPPQNGVNFILDGRNNVSQFTPVCSWFGRCLQLGA